MARLPRVVIVDVPHHVTQRGNARQVIFNADADRLAYQVETMAEREGFSIDPFQQVMMIPTVSDSRLCLCGGRAHS